MKNFSELKVGDRVNVHIFTRTSEVVREDVVARVTKTQVVLTESSTRYKISDGHPVKTTSGLSYITA